MKVYILVEKIEDLYTSEEIIAVYSSLKAAKAARPKGWKKVKGSPTWENKPTYSDEGGWTPTYLIHRMEVDPHAKEEE